jgi:succinate dehydrogenase flavin-adding protein (antitoxin of CptAB toxin-antitoxin module)
MDSPFHQSLDILKVSSHSHFEMLLRVADIDLVRHFTGYFVNDDHHSAVISILTLVWSSPSSAVTV